MMSTRNKLLIGSGLLILIGAIFGFWNIIASIFLSVAGFRFYQLWNSEPKNIKKLTIVGILGMFCAFILIL